MSSNRPRRQRDQLGSLAEPVHVSVDNAQQDPLPVTYQGDDPVPVTAAIGTEPFPVVVQGPVNASVTLRSPEAPNIDDDPALILNVAIRNRSEAISFNRYKEFIDRVLCAPDDDAALGDNPRVVAALRPASRATPVLISSKLSNVYAYELLKSATDAFLLMECGLVPRSGALLDPDDTRIVVEGRRDARSGRISTRDVPGITGAKLGRTLTQNEISRFLADYLGSRGLPYLDLIASTLFAQSQESETPFCDGILPARLEPSFIELIWSYWHEEGMLVQAINAISLRFQNKRSGKGRDPLAHLELDPLRPLNNILWGYIQDESNRLTVARRAYEYQHEYGLAMFGRAVPKLLPADRRSMFIEAFHNLLHLSSIFYKEQSDTMVIADAFPLLNSLKEVHLLLAEGAHNQFGDLPWTARVEMLIQKWLLARPEMQRFLGGRVMVPYQEAWMGVVDGMKALQGWGDVSVRYFRDLAVFGEQLLLAIRYGNWSDINDEQTARNFVNYWRFAMQGYIHAYRAVTGVDLASVREAERLTAESYEQPSVHLRKRLNGQRRQQLTE